MRLHILFIFLLSVMLNSWALTVIVDPYNGLDYDEITAYDLRRDEDLWGECFCPH